MPASDGSDPRIELLLDVPLLRDVDDELRDAVRFEARLSLGLERIPEGWQARAGYVRFSAHAPGEVLVHQADLTTELLVMLSGAVRATHVRPGRAPIEHATYRAGDWFGEVSAVSHDPALATYAAAEPVEVAALDARLFTRLYNEDAGFRDAIDKSYLDRSLLLHLRSSALLRDLDDAALARLQQRAALVAIDKGEVLAVQGQPADAMFLVRSGAIRCSREVDGAARVLAFYKANASFGEHLVTSAGARWEGTYEPIMRSEVVRLPRDAIAGMSRPAGALAANRVVTGQDGEVEEVYSGLAPLGSCGASALDELHVMIQRESVKGGRALVIDQTKCIRCNVCVESCVAVHADRIPRISKIGTKVATDEVLITACYHCEVPECMLACGHGAIRRDPQGRIRFDYDNCVGCTDCISGCPYGVIRLVASAPQKPRAPSWLQRLPWVGDLLGRLVGEGTAAQPAAAAAAAGSGDKAAKPKVMDVGGDPAPVAGKTVKCDLCAGLPFEACVYNCPTSAIERHEPQSLFAPGRRRS